MGNELEQRLAAMRDRLESLQKQPAILAAREIWGVVWDMWAIMADMAGRLKALEERTHGQG